MNFLDLDPSQPVAHFYKHNYFFTSSNGENQERNRPAFIHAFGVPPIAENYTYTLSFSPLQPA